MQTSYRTVAGLGEETLIIKKSRFIGHARPAASEAEATAFIESIRKKHWDANHNCYAYQIGLHDEYQKSNDDGEPSGTAGRPILEVIKKEGLKNVVVVVTRYFGGTLLGAGGLVRAYGQTASAALQAANFLTYSQYQLLQILLDYSWLGKVENETLHAGFFIDRIEYGADVTLFAIVPVAQVTEYTELITNATNGQAAIEPAETIFAAISDGKLLRI